MICRPRFNFDVFFIEIRLLRKLLLTVFLERAEAEFPWRLSAHAQILFQSDTNFSSQFSDSSRAVVWLSLYLMCSLFPAKIIAEKNGHQRCCKSWIGAWTNKSLWSGVLINLVAIQLVSFRIFNWTFLNFSPKLNSRGERGHFSLSRVIFLMVHLSSPKVQ